MEQTEGHERYGRSGINNVYYGQVNKVINLRLNDAQMESIYEDIREMISGDEKRVCRTAQMIMDNHGTINIE